MRKRVGLWINTGTHMGQVFWGEDSHRTSAPFKELEAWGISKLTEHCNRKGWEWQYITVRT